MKKIVNKGKKASEYLWKYAKMSGLFPDFNKKDNKGKGGGKK
jgi:hypothetical protein